MELSVVVCHWLLPLKPGELGNKKNYKLYYDHQAFRKYCNNTNGSIPVDVGGTSFTSIAFLSLLFWSASSTHCLSNIEFIGAGVISLIFKLACFRSSLFEAKKV